MRAGSLSCCTSTCPPTRPHRLHERPAPGGVLLVPGHDVANLTDGYGGPQDPSILFTATTSWQTCPRRA